MHYVMSFFVLNSTLHFYYGVHFTGVGCIVHMSLFWGRYHKHEYICDRLDPMNIDKDMNIDINVLL